MLSRLRSCGARSPENSCNHDHGNDSDERSTGAQGHAEALSKPPTKPALSRLLTRAPAKRMDGTRRAHGHRRIRHSPICKSTLLCDNDGGSLGRREAETSVTHSGSLKETCLRTQVKLTLAASEENSTVSIPHSNRQSLPVRACQVCSLETPHVVATLI